MKYKFTQSVRINKHTFKVGLRDVSYEIEEHPHFLKYLQCGWVKPATPAEVRADESSKLPKDEQSRNAKLFEKLVQKDPESADEAEEESPQKRGARTRKANAEKQKG